jgi:sugar fermentation stimulation protein A
MDTRGETIPRDPGVYALWLAASGSASIEVGKLGRVHVVPGRAYVYVGSAMGGLAGRIGRHLASSGKKRHWHVDYLLEHLAIKAVYFALSPTRKECELSMALHALTDHVTPIRGFGNSDCHVCPSHLYEVNAHDEPGSMDSILRAAFRGLGLEPLVLNFVNNRTRKC